MKFYQTQQVLNILVLKLRETLIWVARKIVIRGAVTKNVSLAKGKQFK